MTHPPHPLVPLSSNRLFALDLLKAISITAVVSYHAMLVPRSTYADSLPLLEISAGGLRFCVPVLFTISFFLLARSLDKTDLRPWQLLKKRLIRLLIPTTFWFGLATLLKSLTRNPFPHLMERLVSGNIFQGAYFLLVLLQCLPLFLLILARLRQPAVLYGMITLQCLMLLATYHWLVTEQTWVIDVLRRLDRPCLIYWFGYMAMGISLWQKWPKIIQRSSQIPNLWKGIFLAIAWGLLSEEYRRLWIVTQGDIPPFDYALASCLLSVVVLFLCFASLTAEQVPLLPRQIIFCLSRYSLGIFCSNGIVSEIGLAMGSRWLSGAHFSLVEAILLKMGGWLGLLLISLGLSMLLDRVKLGVIVR
ncbi:MAG: acyltransferase [Acaryochloris sp. RU_4_1]|nr:acyltransferase [Acaryochloris sp. RU_4_1]